MGTEARTIDPAALGIPAEPDAPLGPSTWYKVGGSAELLARPRSVEQLATLAARCHETDTPLRVLGKGANLLVDEGTVPGVVVSLSEPAMRRTEIDPTSGTVTARAGADLERLVTDTVRAGLAGLEGLAGIPATVGGAVRMNAGGSFGQVADALRSVTVVEPDGTTAEWSADQLGLGYRRSNLTGRIVADATFALTPTDDQPALRRRLKEVMSYKSRSQPMAARSSGCAFKNPIDRDPRGAGQLIDEAGLKGFRIGGAWVSDRHANFIVVEPGGSASDIRAVLEHVEQQVFETFGIRLERELVVWERSSELGAGS